jgi:hypothetical protein
MILKFKNSKYCLYWLRKSLPRYRSAEFWLKSGPIQKEGKREKTGPHRARVFYIIVIYKM